MNLTPEQRRPVLHAIMNAVHRLHPQRGVVLFAGEAGFQLSDISNIQDWCAEHVLEIPGHIEVKFPWLFPHCHAVLCHGGSGVIAAALRAGVPVAVAPVLSDQFFYAHVVEFSGLGVFLGQKLVNVTEEQVFVKLDDLEDKELRDRVKRYAEMRNQSFRDGCAELVGMIENSVS